MTITEECRRKRSEDMKKRRSSPEFQKKLNEAMRKKDVLEKKSISMKKIWQSPSHQEKVSLGNKKAWKNPSIRRNIMTSLNSEEIRQKRSLKLKNWWKNPNNIEKRRKAFLSYIDKNGWLSIGRNEKEILDQLEIDLNTKFIRQYHVNGYRTDGYSPDLNLVVEIDEMRRHRYITEKDKKREKDIIETLQCDFIRVMDE